MVMVKNQTDKLSKACLHRYTNKAGHKVIQLCPMDGKLDGSRLILTYSQINKFCTFIRKTKPKFFKDTKKFGVSDENPELYFLVNDTMKDHLKAKGVNCELKQLQKKEEMK